MQQGTVNPSILGALGCIGDSAAELGSYRHISDGFAFAYRANVRI